MVSRQEETKHNARQQREEQCDHVHQMCGDQMCEFCVLSLTGLQERRRLGITVSHRHNKS